MWDKTDQLEAQLDETQQLEYDKWLALHNMDGLMPPDLEHKLNELLGYECDCGSC